jgi:hypothetical protein
LRLHDVGAQFVGIDADGGIELRARLVRAVLGDQHRRALVQQAAIEGSERDRAIERGMRRRRVAGHRQRDRQQPVRLRIVRCGGRGGASQLDATGVLAAAQGFDDLDLVVHGVLACLAAARGPEPPIVAIR